MQPISHEFKQKRSPYRLLSELVNLETKHIAFQWNFNAYRNTAITAI